MARRGEIRASLLDRVIAAFDPGRGLRRMRDRTLFHAVAGGYDGARRDRRGLREFRSGGGSADADLNGDLATLRERTRDLARNSSIGGGAIHTVVNHVVGTGLRLNARVDREALGLSPDEAKAFERDAERGFRHWCGVCDWERTLSFYELQEQVFRSVLESGDCLVLLPWKQRPGEIWGQKLQVVEGDRLSNPDHRSDSDTLRGGVELDADGVPVAHHILSSHPGEATGVLKREWKRYPAYTPDGRPAVLHIFRKLRPGQHRGVPYLAPVIEDLKQLARYTEAEIMAAVVSGLFTGFITSESREGLDPTGLLATDGKVSEDEGELKLGNGLLVGLAEGEDIKFSNPGRPNQAFDGFVLAVCRQIGMALELPYEVLVKHFTASYSASRAALQEAWTFFRSRRAWLVQRLCAPVYEAWMTEAVARGYLYAPGFLTDPLVRAAYLQAEWIGSAPAQLDPVKEVQAAEKRLALKLTTRSEECAALVGNDWEAKVPQMRYEEELAGTAADGGDEPDEDRTDGDDGDETDGETE